MPPESIETKVKELAQTVEDKLGVNKQEVLDQWEKELELVAELRSDLPKEDQSKRAFLRLRGNWKRELRSPAKFYEGMVIRVAPPFDVLRSIHNAARLIYEKDPQKAIAEGWTDEAGNALDNKRQYSTGRDNPDFGKKLPPTRFIQNVMGVAKSSDMQTPMVFGMVLSDRIAGHIDIPVFQTVKFRANLAKKQPTDGSVSLNEYAGLRFMPVEIEGFPGPEAIIDQFFEDHKSTIEDLEAWHNDHEQDPRRFVIVSGDVDDVDTRANATTGNARMVILDDSGEVEVTVWIPDHLRNLLDFGAGSRVIVDGRTAISTFNDQKQVLINGEGIYAPPHDKIPLEETPESIVSGATDVN